MSECVHNCFINFKIGFFKNTQYPGCPSQLFCLCHCLSVEESPGRATIWAVSHIWSLLCSLLLHHQLLLHRLPVKALHCHRHDHWLVFLHFQANCHSGHWKIPNSGTLKCLLQSSWSSGNSSVRELVCLRRPPPLARHPGVAGGSSAGANSSSSNVCCSLFAANF